MIWQMVRDAQQRSRWDRRSVILGVMAGAVLEFFWDPNEGKSRRAVTRDQFRAAVRHGYRRLIRQARYIKGLAFGAAEETFYLHEVNNPDPDDSTLRDRVESELFRDLTVPKARLSVNVAAGIVELRGQVEHADDIDAILAKVEAIEGVHLVHNYLHLPNMPAPNKARVLSIS